MPIAGCWEEGTEAEDKPDPGENPHLSGIQRDILWGQKHTGQCEMLSATEPSRSAQQ